MGNLPFLKSFLIFIITGLAALTFSAGGARAHCDSLSGPVAVDALQALKNENFQTVAIWVGKEQHENLRETFEETLPVYRMGGKARNLAQRYFIETAIRLHRQAEGMPFTGVKPPRPLPDDIAAAEQALESGNLKPASDMLENAMHQKLEHLFLEAREAKQHKDESLAKGREWADAYVKYVIYVHGLYKTIIAGPAHGVGE